jgi:hypothetical protein
LLRIFFLCKPSLIEDKKYVASLVAGGVSPNVTRSDGLTALHIAASKNLKKMSELLIGAGAKIEAVLPKSGATPLFIACQDGGVKVVRLLLGMGAKMTCSVGTVSPLFIAAQEGYNCCFNSIMKISKHPKYRSLRNCEVASRQWRRRESMHGSRLFASAGCCSALPSPGGQSSARKQGWLFFFFFFFFFFGFWQKKKKKKIKRT